MLVDLDVCDTTLEPNAVDGTAASDGAAALFYSGVGTGYSSSDQPRFAYSILCLLTPTRPPPFDFLGR